MNLSEARGYYFEEIVRELMRKTNYIDVKSQDIAGRGADHQIDSVGYFAFTIPFMYPVRLIAEAKWYQDDDKIGLGKIRDFVGVMKDISENYFVPTETRRARTRPKLEDRFTDAGAYFSVSGFSSRAQDYAWAHGIYLISFGMNTIFQPLISRARTLIDRDITDTITKAGVVELAKGHIENDDTMRTRFNGIFSYVGILDGIYPVMITADREIEFDPSQPDNLQTTGGGIREGAIKDYRRERPDNVNFRFHFRDSNFEFTLPSHTSENLIEAIETSYEGRPFGFIDLPIELKTDNGNFRRVFRLNLSLPEDNRIVRTLKRQEL